MIRTIVTLVLALGAVGGGLGGPAAAGDVPAEMLQDAQHGGQVARGRVVITGSETMSPFTQRVFEVLAAGSKVPRPEIQPQGTHTGFVKFCEGIGAEYPDMVAATRRMRQSELDACIAHAIADIIEVPIGFSAVAFVSRRDDLPVKLTPRILYQAIAADVPVGQDLVANPYNTWQQIERKLPATNIRIILPGVLAGTRNFFDDMFMQGGCRKFSVMKNIFDDRDRVKLCVTARKDDHVVELPANYDDLLPQKLGTSPPGTIGILPYHVAVANQDKLQILPVNDVLPTPATIVDDSYEGVHTLYYYIKRAHMRDSHGNGVVRGLRQFIIEATSEAARGPGGYLASLGVVPLPDDVRVRERRSALRLERFTR